MLYMVTFTINIPPMWAYIPAPWILWDIYIYRWSSFVCVFSMGSSHCQLMICIDQNLGNQTGNSSTVASTLLLVYSNRDKIPVTVLLNTIRFFLENQIQIWYLFISCCVTTSTSSVGKFASLVKTYRNTLFQLRKSRYSQSKSWQVKTCI